MAILIKNRARQPLERAAISSVGFYPAGVGGMVVNDPCIMIHIGEHKLVMTTDEYTRLQQSIERARII